MLGPDELDRRQAREAASWDDDLSAQPGFLCKEVLASVPVPAPHGA